MLCTLGHRIEPLAGMRRTLQIVAAALAPASTGGLVVHDATTNPPHRPTLKVLYMTAVHPVDIMPIDEVVAHHLRALAEPNVKLRALVYNNTPTISGDSPGLPARLEFNGMGAQDYALRELARKNKDITIKKMPWKQALSDPHFIDPILNVANNSRTFDRIGQEGILDIQHQGNFLTMFHYLLECAHSREDLCLYLDPDILLYRNTSDLLNLAANSFRQNPKMVMMSPPYGCHNQESPMKIPKNGGSDNPENAGGCLVHQTFVSSRHLLINRTRFVNLLPLKAEPYLLGRFMEELLTTVGKGIDGDFSGQMMCGWEFFAVHPPSRFQRSSNRNFPFADLLTRLAGGPNGSKTVTDAPTARKGAQELIRRFESGLFSTKTTGRGYNPDNALQNDACSCCADMLPSAERVEKGLAFAMEERDAGSGFESAFQGATNDATFDWVTQCGA